jgi:hypothetical protein
MLHGTSFRLLMVIAALSGFVLGLAARRWLGW